jgi:hypothetical protein
MPTDVALTAESKPTTLRTASSSGSGRYSRLGGTDRSDLALTTPSPNFATKAVCIILRISSESLTD